MPPAGVTCNRCKQTQPLEGEAWCGACSAWESLGRELTVPWDQAGCRAVAADLIINTSRQVRALRSLGAGISRSTQSAGASRADSAGNRRAEGDSLRLSEKEGPRASLPRKKAPPPPPPCPVPKEEVREPEGEAEDEESEEEEERSLDPLVRSRGPDRGQPPPEPENNPPRKRDHKSRENPIG